jgi:hypothetical protein
MRGASQPSEAVHSRESMWSVGGQKTRLSTFGLHLPVNVLPNTNSLGATSSLGVVLLVMDSLEGSMSCSFIVDAASALILMLRVHDAASLEGCLNALWGRSRRSMIAIGRYIGGEELKEGLGDSLAL